MTEPQLHHIHCPDAHGGHRMAYWAWGNPQAQHVVVCAHGLSRQGRDFDVLAQALLVRGGDALRVICPDVVGRGQSDWLTDPAAYVVATYAADMLAMLGQIKLRTLDWVGTSMGGLIGMALAGHAESPATIRRLVLNDVGPVLEWDSLVRIGTYLGQPARFETPELAADFLRSISPGFGPHTSAQWLALSRPMVKPAGDGEGGYVLHYDPAIAQPFKAVTREAVTAGEAQLWHLYDTISATTLLLRGAESDLLTPETAQAMTQRGPRARLVSFAGVGHAPTLIAADQVQTVCDFLLKDQ